MSESFPSASCLIVENPRRPLTRRRADTVRAAEAPGHGSMGPASDGQTRQSPEGDGGISNNLSCISRDGKLDLEDLDGQII